LKRNELSDSSKLCPTSINWASWSDDSVGYAHL
jgi:hypothetical protein